MSNFLPYLPAFSWSDIAISRADCLDKLTEVMELIRVNEDRLLGHPDFYSLQLPWGYFYEIIDELDFEVIRDRMPWIRKDHHRLLQRLLHSNSSGMNSRSIADLDIEFVGDLNCLLGCRTNPEENHVYDKVRYNEKRVEHFRQRPNLINWRRADHLFLPNIKYSNSYLAVLESSESIVNNLEQAEIDDLAHTYCTKTIRRISPGGNKEATAKQIGAEIARRNFYNLCEDISAEEQRLQGSLRSIFSLQLNGELCYLSVDFEKATFERCDSRGRHLGEYLLDGTLNRDADSSGDHDILVLRR